MSWYCIMSCNFRTSIWCSWVSHNDRVLCHVQALVHYVTIAREIPQPDRFLSFLPRGTNTFEPSGPMTMSATASIIMCLIKDGEITVQVPRDNLALQYTLGCTKRNIKISF